MKKLRILSLLLVGMPLGVNAMGPGPNTVQALSGGDATGQTFFWARPQFQDAMPEKVSLFRNDRAMARDCGWGGAFQIVPFGGRTTNNDSKRLARYFMFEEKSQLSVVGGLAPLDGPIDQGIGLDVNAFDFNILYEIDSDAVPFSSTLIFKPRQSVVGAGFDWIQYFGWGDCCERKWWGEISFPVLRVKNDMRLTETNVTITPGSAPAAGTAANMTQAFTGQFAGDVSWDFGIINGPRKKTGVADVEVKIGYDYMHTDCAYLYSYFGVLAPTGTTPKAVYVFEPILGENRHVGILTGGSGGYKIWEGCGDKSLWFDCDVAWRYLIRKTELRSFDLYNRPWSRYMYVFADEAAATAGTGTPGINTFTQKMKVHPGFQFDMNWAVVYNTECGFEAEVGYNLWARQAEKVKLSTPWAAGPVIAATSLNDVTVNTINRISNIGANFGGANLVLTALDPGVTVATAIIQPGDLNLNSAACPAALTQTVYGTFGYNWDWCWPIDVAVGASYEWSKINTALTRWAVWGKFGISI